MTNFDKLVSKLSELFELQKADLDFGIHRIIKARQRHIRIFLGLDLPPAGDTGAPTLQKIVQREMGELNTVEVERQLEATATKIKTNYGQLAFDASGNLADGPGKDSADGQQWLILHEQLDSGSVEANLQLEAEIYSHLTEFFSRYYDEADFLSKRRIKAGDAPYAVPYSGEEVMLHWANKDQYYIKSSKDLKDYTFTLPERFEGKRVQFKCERQDPVLNNNNAKREFHLDEEAEIEIADDHLVVPFHFKIVDKTRTQPEAKKWIESIVAQLPPEWQQALNHTPEGAKNNLITRHLSNYTRKNESDFFIHKHLGKFLRGELDFYIKNEVMHLDDIDTKSTDYLATRVRLIKALRTIARHIITFLAQLENFQKKLWLKKKYVTETHYCITLDRLFAAENGEALIAAVLEHCETKIPRYDGDLRSQRDEWVKLYAINELEDYPQDGPLTEAFLRANDKMIVDTVFYPQGFKWELLGGIEDLDASLDGLLLHSENFQALNLLQERYREKVKCVYIDPPYNTDADRNTGKFIYKDCFARSSWISFIMNRLDIEKSLHRSDFLFFSSIDENEVYRLGELLETNFLNRVGIFTWVKKRKGSHLSKTVRDMTEYILAYANPNSIVELYGEHAYAEKAQPLAKRTNKHKSLMFRAGVIETTLDDGIYEPGLYGSGSSSINFPKGFEVKNAIVVSDFTATGPFVWTQDTLDEEIRKGSSVKLSKKFGFNVLRSGQDDRIKRPSTLLDSKAGVGTNEEGSEEILALFAEEGIASYPKPSALIAYLTNSVTYKHKDALILDYFAGSGTTAHAVINLNREDSGSRKYILVEMGDHFDTVLKPRIQKVVYSKDWKDGKPVPSQENRELTLIDANSEDSRALASISGSIFSGISHAFKYLRLESYEDALNNLDLGEDRAPDLLGLGDQVREDYLFSYLLDVETRGHLLNLDRFRDPFGCQLKIHDPHSGKSEPRVIDLVETFNYLLGITVREVKCREGFLTIEGESPTGQTILILWRKLDGESDWPVTTNEDLKTFVRQTLRLNPADTEYHAIYLNGDHTLEDPQSKIHCIEEVFYERMFENTGNPED